MSTPPRLAALLFEGLGADSEYRDAMLGDLAEEFDERVVLVGTPAARRWYYCETLRSSTALVRSWFRRLTWSGAGEVLGVAVSSWLLAAFPLFAAVAVVEGLLRLAQLSVIGLHPLYLMPLLVPTAIGAGAFAASLHERAPLVAATILGALYMIEQTLGIALAFAPEAKLIGQLVLPPLMLASTIIGGLLRVSYMVRSREDTQFSASRGE